MKTYNQWRFQESFDADWERIKNIKLPVESSVKNFVMSKMSEVQDRIVQLLKSDKIQSFRDVPPETRDQYAKAILAATMELFYPTTQNVTAQPEAKKQKMPIGDVTMPQDELITPAASKG